MIYAHGYDKGAKMTRLQMWQEIKARSGKVKKELQEFKPLRPELGYLWDIFCAISKGCKHIGYVDIESYCRLMNVSLEAWEINILLDIEKARSS